jgi:microcystin-dependent protein
MKSCWQFVVLVSAVALLSAGALANNTTTPTKPFTFTAGGTIRASELNSDYDTAYNELQGNIGTANLLDNAISTPKIIANAVTEAKLDSAVVLKLEQTGVVKDYIGIVAPPGYVLASGRTLGNAASGGTGRANADTQALFVLIYISMTNAEAAVSGGRTGSGTTAAEAATDYAANKTIVIPDLRGRVVAGADNMGGSTASRITVAGGNFAGTTNGLAGGLQNHTLTMAQLAAHSHGVTDPGHFHTAKHTNNPSLNGTGAGVDTSDGIPNMTDTKTTGITINSAGSGNAHPILQPTMILNKIIKL